MFRVHLENAVCSVLVSNFYGAALRRWRDAGNCSLPNFCRLLRRARAVRTHLAPLHHGNLDCTLVVENRVERLFHFVRHPGWLWRPACTRSRLPIPPFLPPPTIRASTPSVRILASTPSTHC